MSTVHMPNTMPHGQTAAGIQKAKTGIVGLDELTGGGLPAGRPTLVCGAAGCGKTLLAVTFLHNGAAHFDEPGVFMTFEERPEDLVNNVVSLQYDLGRLIKERKLVIDHVRVERSEIEETGEYDLEGLFIRLGYAIDKIGAKRVVLDTIEALFGGLSNEGVLRAELRRLFEWLKNKGVTAIITGERGEGQLTRHGLEEYVSDCVILLDHRVHEHITTRRLRVVKYRGTAHGTNEYPFLIDRSGINVMPITSAGLDHVAPDKRITSGIADLDQMLQGKGYFRGSSILVSGMAGSGKSSIAAQFADAVCRGGERCIYFALEESPSQIIRNMRSIGLDLQPSIDAGKLRFASHRPSLFGLETHLATMHRDVEEFEPAAVVIDPLSSLLQAGEQHDAQAMILRLVDFLRARTITSVFTSLTHGNVELAHTDMQVSSLMDTWLLLYNRESNGEHNRQLYLIKSRGMAHSNQVREFIMTDNGIRLREVYVGPEGVLIGSARVAQEARERERVMQIEHETECRDLEFARRRRRIEAQIAELQAQLADEEQELSSLKSDAAARRRQAVDEQVRMQQSRMVVARPAKK
ncbi:MAG TPA: circadian clock protein KaiC [Xanthobacteraceae bacterium]